MPECFAFTRKCTKMCLAARLHTDPCTGELTALARTPLAGFKGHGQGYIGLWGIWPVIAKGRYSQL